MTLDPLISLAGYLGLALIFVAASIHKLGDLPGFRGVLVSYALLPPILVAPAPAALGVAELLVAVGLAARQPQAALAGAGLLALYALAMAVNLARGRRLLDCGCSTRPRRLSWQLVGRNLALVGMSVALLIPPGERALGWLDVFTVVCALAAAASLHGAVDNLAAVGSASEETV